MNVLSRILAVSGTFDGLKNNLQSAKNRTANAVKPVLKQTNERFD